MHYSLPLMCGALALVAACGPAPAGPGDTDSDSSSGDPPGTSGSLDPTADPPPTTSGPTTSGPTTGEPTSGETTADPTTGDMTTGAPVACPEGQARWERISGAPLALPEGVSLAPVMAPTADGGIALGARVTLGEQSAAGLLLLSPTGELLGVQSGEPGGPGEPLFASALARAADDRMILFRHRDQFQMAVPGFARFAADGTPLGTVELPEALRHSVFALVDDDAVLAGRGTGVEQWWVRRLEVDTGAEGWKSDLAGSEGNVNIQTSTVGPQGDVLLAGLTPGDNASTRLLVWRLDPGGAAVWSRAIELPTFELVPDIALGPDGHVLVLRAGPWPGGPLDLLALDFETGADRWAVTVAEADPELRFALGATILVDAEALSIPVARSGPDMFTLESVAVQQVSFAGQLQALIPLDVPPQAEFNLQAMRGACGQLVVWAGFESAWIGTFAP